MAREFRGLYARALCHSTEDIDKVRRAVTNVVGQRELEEHRTDGVHGNPIIIVEATVLDSEEISGFFARLRSEDLDVLLNTLDKRVDESCNMFAKIDKQAAYLGDVRLGSEDDFISVRLRISSFPATCDAATSVVRRTLVQELARRREKMAAEEREK